MTGDSSYGRFRGLTILVVGGSSGIGEASAHWFASRGADVFVSDIDRIEASEQRFQDAGISFLVGDVRVDSEVAHVVDQIVATSKKIDVLVYSAGIEVPGQIPDVSVNDWDRCLDTNFKGAFLFARRVIPIMAKHGGGAIVHIASNAGILPRAHDPVYSTSKGALVAFTKSLALCHAKDRIRVNALCPGPVEGTRMMEKGLQHAEDPDQKSREIIAASPIAEAYGRMATTKEMADAIGFLADPDSAFVTGAILAIDGAKSLGVPPNFRPVLD